MVRLTSKAGDRPPYVPFSWTAIVGCRTGGEGSSGCGFLHIRPALLLKEGGRPSPTVKECCVGNGFCAAKFRHPPKKEGPDCRIEAQCRVACFLAVRLAGRGDRAALPDAHNVTRAG